MMKTTIRFVLLMLIWLAAERVDGQYYSKRYTFNTLGTYISSVQIVNDTIYAMAQAIDSLHKNIAVFATLNQAGQEISTQYFDIANRTGIGVTYNSLIKTNDGGFAYGGWTVSDSQNVNSILLLKYDRHGIFQWYKEIIDSNNLGFYCSRIVQDSEKNFYLTGTYIQEANAKGDVYLTKTDSVGNLIYTKIFQNYLLDDFANDVHIEDNGHIILMGEGADYNYINLSTEKDYSEFYEIDTAGILLSYSQGTDTNGPGVGSFVQTDDKGYMTCGEYYCYRDADQIKWTGALTKVDSGFHQLWKTNLGNCNQNTSFLTNKRISDGSYIAAGQFYNDEDTPVAHIRGWLVKYTEAGNVIWNKQFSGVNNNGAGGDFNQFTSMSSFSDGTILYAGEATNYNAPSYNEQGWLLHLDTAGCLPDSNNCGIIDAIIAPPTSEAEIRVYPNPAADVMTIACRTDEPSVRTISIGDMLGQVMAERVLGMDEAAVTQDVRLWPAGVYSYRVVSEKGFVGAGSFVVNH